MSVTSPVAAKVPLLLTLIAELVALPVTLIAPPEATFAFTATPPITVDVPIKVTSLPAVILALTLMASSLAELAFKAVNNTVLGVVIPTWL